VCCNIVSENIIIVSNFVSDTVHRQNGINVVSKTKKKNPLTRKTRNEVRRRRRRDRCERRKTRMRCGRTAVTVHDSQRRRTTAEWLETIETRRRANIILPEHTAARAPSRLTSDGDDGRRRRRDNENTTIIKYYNYYCNNNNNNKCYNYNDA